MNDAEEQAGKAVERQAGGGSRWKLPTIWWPLGLGVVALLLAIGLEHVTWVSEGVAAAGNSSEPAAPHGAASASSIFRWETVILLVSEVGYAFIIAWVVSYFIESAARREQNEEFARSMSEISREVFRGVFRIRHRPEYVKAVVSNCLETRLIREGYDVTYTVDAFSEEDEARFGLDPGRFVSVGAAIRYRARNIGTKKETFTTSYGIPVRSGRLRGRSELTGLRVGSRAYLRDELAELVVKDAPASVHPSETMYRFSFELDPQQSAEIFIEAVLIKERSDSETFGFGLPTMDAVIRLNMNVPLMKFGATPRIIGDLREVRSPANGRSGEWKIERPILPYNSVILWWRSPEDDGSAGEPDGGDAAEAPTEASQTSDAGASSGDAALAAEPPRKGFGKGFLGSLKGVFSSRKPPSD